jgi:ABC-2 type transport system ATP-binding protein
MYVRGFTGGTAVQRFTYHKKGARLRTQVNTFLTVVLAEMAAYLIVGLFLPAPWNWLLLGILTPISAIGVWVLTKEYRLAHELTPEVLTLRTRRLRLQVTRTQIAGVTRFQGAVPRGEIGPYYDPATDALLHLPDTRRVVEIRLTEPMTAVLGKKGMPVSFTSLLVVVDEPEGLIKALAPEAPAVSPPAVSVVSRPALRGAAPAPQGEPLLYMDGLAKRFGDFQAVHPLTLSINPGEILAFLGGNGAGKTTTIRMITGLLRPTAGRVQIGGIDAWERPREARRLIGYVPDNPLLWEGLTAQEFLWLVAGLHGIPEREAKARTGALLARLQLTPFADRLLRNFSLGMKRKMAIAAAQLHQPKLLLLDEVTNGLDPRASREVKDQVLAAAREGSAVFLTTHILDVAAELADRVAILDRGQLRAVGTIAELQEMAGLPGANLEALFLALTTPVREVGA